MKSAAGRITPESKSIGCVASDPAQGVFVNAVNAFFNSSSSSSLGKGAGQAWCLFCVLILFFISMAGQALAVPPGTSIANTAQASYSSWGTAAAINSNSVSIVSERFSTPSQIELLQYAPALSGASLVTVPSAGYSDTGTTAGMVSISSLHPAGSPTPIDLAAPVPLIGASVIHQGEPLFFRVSDPDQNIYPALVETIWIQVSVSGSAESELLLLTEIGPDAGVFMGYIQSENLGAGTEDDFNGMLDVHEGVQVQARYSDIADAGDTVTIAALVDPYGLVFDTTTGLPLDGVQLTLVDASTGAPANVYGDDGVSAFPSTIASGGTITDDSGKVYAFAAGNYRFPFVTPGTYRLLITPPTGYAAPSTVATSVLQTLPGAPFAIAEPGSRGEAFVLNPGPAIRLDIPVDRTSTALWLNKTANREVASVGDFVQYTVTAENLSGALVSNVTVVDALPPGFRYRQGSARMDGRAIADPQIVSDGRTLTFFLGDLPVDASAQIRYVTEIAAGARPGPSENRVAGTADGGLTSNTATATVTVKEDLFRSKNIIVGRVMANNCNDALTDAADGVPGVRIYLEDGTFVITDEQGRYHFEGMASGTHVVQLDLESLPTKYEIALCDDDTRWAGTPFSRFVDLHGGTLWRADFHVQTKTPPSGEARLRLSCGLEAGTVNYQAEIGIRTVAVDNLRLTVLLPESSEYISGTSRMDSQDIDDPQIMGDVLTYRLGNAAPGRTCSLRFGVRLDADSVQPGQLHTKALMTFNAPRQKNQRTALIDTILALSRRKVRTVQAPIVVHPQFDSLSAVLSRNDRRMLARLVEKLKSLEIEHIVCTGHSDNQPIRPNPNGKFADNEALSLARARNVAAFLAERLNLSERQMTIVGKGADFPLADNTTEQGRAMNRRVEVRVMSAEVQLIHDIASIKCEDQVVSSTQGEVQGQADTASESNIDAPSALQFEDIDIDKLSPGLAWLMPGQGYSPNIASIKLAIQHQPQEKIELLLNDLPVSPLNFDGQRQNKARTVAVSFWRGVDLSEGDNRFVVICKDRNGQQTQRIAHTVHYAGAPVFATLIKEKSSLVANGKDVPRLAVRLTDKDGHPARFGTFGEYAILPPYRAYEDQKGAIEDPVARISEEKARYIVGNDGIAVIKLEPTAQSGYATITIPLSNKIHEIRAWLQPELRDWILVGLAEGTVGYNTVSGNLESLSAADGEEDLYQDGRLAFFAKGRIKGSWLLTMAYDSGRGHKDLDNRLFQTIDPDAYYTLYGDASQQQYEASSIRKFYLKIEREQFYALFGDFDTGLTVTELSRYSRRLNGLKSEYEGDRFGFSAFAADTDQAFVKDEIRGDGTSGLYRLSRKSIVPNSEKVVIETRDRFHSEIIVATQSLTRHIDYTIDYDDGTLFFKTPIYSRDENFNPNYIVAEYEGVDASETSYTYGGRGSVKLANGKMEVGATYIHEGPQNAAGRLAGMDAKIDLGNGLQIKAEAATTHSETSGQEIAGQGYLAQISKESADLDARLYFREQGQGFGLGQQNGGEAETRKIGAEGAWRVKENWKLSGELYRQSNLATDAQRDLGEARVEFNRPVYSLYSGARLAEDRLGDGQIDRSDQLIVGGVRRLMDNRLQARFSHEQSIGGGNESADFPTRTILGADYKIIDAVTLFAEHEITQGQSADTQSSRLGAKATPWSGGQIGSSVGRQFGENGQRVFANLGLNQTWRINDRWSVDGGLDRTQTVSHEQAKPSFNPNVPTAAGAEEDFTAISLGAGYKADLWSWNARLEGRTSESEDKTGLITGIAGEVRQGLGLSAGLELFTTETAAGEDTLDGTVRFSMASRPKNTRWIVLDRLEYIFENQKDADGNLQARRVVNNLNANYKPHQRLQLSLQYGAKYVFDTIDGASYDGYTDLTGLEARYDLSAKWDLGLHAGALHSWNAGQIDYRTGLSVGYALVKNMWVSLGYNFSGFKDQDFSGADYTAAGPYARFRIKFDQQSVREMVNWFAR